jgi:DNA-binding NtrC family response regulator
MNRPRSLSPDNISTSPGSGNDWASQELPFNATRAISLNRSTFKVRRCRWIVIAGPDAGAELFTEKERIRVGSHRSNDLVLARDRAASRHHFEVYHTERGYLLVDLNSTNGTYLDGRRAERVYLTQGSKVRAGLSTLSFTPLDEEVTIEPDELGELGGMVGLSEQMRQIFAMIKKIAPMNVPVIIQGETGTGKELVARAIHECSQRRGGPFVVLDCGAIQPSLIESELFGHEKGAFTGAIASRPGAFERADGGTIFLDELGELRFDLQPKLLRVLENRELRRLGGNSLVGVDVRVLAATHRDLAKEIQQGHFREDLYFRLSVTHIHLPPLRDRKEDIPAILERALSDPEVLAKHGHQRFTSSAMDLLMAYRWPGNVRELMNVLANALTFSQTEEIDARHLPLRIQAEVGDEPLSFNEHLPFKVARDQLLERFEREYLAQALKRCRGNVARASRETGLHRRSIERLAKKHQLATGTQKPK